MWVKFMRWLAPIAVNAVAEHVLARKGRDEYIRPSRPAIDGAFEADARFAALQNQIDRLSDALAKQSADLTTLTHAVSGRLQIALWLSVASAVTTLAILIVVLLR